MVQGECVVLQSCDGLERSQESKTAGFNAMQKKDEEQRQVEKNLQVDKKYGSWGPVFKNNEHFLNMHIC